MDAVERQSFWRFSNPIMWACIATMGFITLIVWFGLAPTCNGDLFPKGDCPPKWRHLYAAPPNEVGDTLAGLAGVLAFIWLIATVLLQSVELGEQRRVLALQKGEMEEQRKATQDMATAMAAQASIFEDEKKQREHIRSNEVLVRRLEKLLSKIKTSREVVGYAVSRGKHLSGLRSTQYTRMGDEFFVHVFGTYNGTLDDDLVKLGQDLDEAKLYISFFDREEAFTGTWLGETVLNELLSISEEIHDSIQGLSEADQIYLEKIGLLEIRRSIAVLVRKFDEMLSQP